MKFNLNESISDKPSVNAQIELLLKKYDSEQQTRILDALEALKDAGSTGLSPADWANKVKILHPDGSYVMSDLLKTVVRDFNCCVRRAGEKLYVWDDADRDLEDVDADLAAAMLNQVQVTNMSMALMKEMGEFTLDEIAAKISEKTRMPLEVAKQYVEHLVQQFSGGTISPIEGDRYRFNAEKSKTSAEHMADLRDLLSKVGLGSQD